MKVHVGFHFCVCKTVLAQAATIKYHRLGVLNSNIYFLYFWRLDQGSMIKELEDSVSD